MSARNANEREWANAANGEKAFGGLPRSKGFQSLLWMRTITAKVVAAQRQCKLLPLRLKQFRTLVSVASLLLATSFLAACAPASKTPPDTTATFPAIILPETPTPAMPPCNSLQTMPTPAAEDSSLFPPITQADRTRGAADAPVTLLFYGDFQDPPSAVFANVLQELIAKYPEELRVAYRDFPLVTNPGHEKAGYAAHAAHAAALQGKYWEMHDLLFEKQEEWSPLSAADFERWLAEQAERLELDAAQFNEDRQSDAVVEKVRQAFVAGQEIALPGTPFLLINGQIYAGPLDFGSLDQIVALIILGEKQFTDCPPFVIDPDQEYLARLHTEKGEIVFQFFPDEAPIAVNNFIFLAREGWYEDITFHRVVPGAFAETGDPSGTGRGNPGYYFQNEISDSLKFDRPGRVAMKNLGENTNGSQFFITYTAAPAYDGKYTIFGQVLSGMDVLENLSPRDAQRGEILPEGDALLSVTIEER